MSLAAGLSESALGKIEAGTTEPSLRAFALTARQLRLNDREIAFLVRLAAQGNVTTTLTSPPDQ